MLGVLRPGIRAGGGQEAGRGLRAPAGTGRAAWGREPAGLRGGQPPPPALGSRERRRGLPGPNEESPRGQEAQSWGQSCSSGSASDRLCRGGHAPGPLWAVSLPVTCEKGASARAGGRGQTKRRACSETPPPPRVSPTPSLPRDWGSEGRKGTRAGGQCRPSPPLPQLCPRTLAFSQVGRIDGPTRVLRTPGLCLKERGSWAALPSHSCCALRHRRADVGGRPARGREETLLRFLVPPPPAPSPAPPPPAQRQEARS